MSVKPSKDMKWACPAKGIQHTKPTPGSSTQRRKANKEAHRAGANRK